jgi:hypothetical protein
MCREKVWGLGIGDWAENRVGKQGSAGGMAQTSVRYVHLWWTRVHPTYVWYCSRLVCYN